MDGGTYKEGADKEMIYSDLEYDYNKIKNSDLRTKFLWIETRLREFEK